MTINAATSPAIQDPETRAAKPHSSQTHGDSIVAAATGVNAPLAAVLGAGEWQTHLRDAPEGRLFLTAHYDTGAGDILTSLARRDGSLMATHLCIPDWPSDQHRFLLFGVGKAREVTMQECRRAIQLANRGAPQVWTYPSMSDRYILPGRHIALAPEHAPAWEDLAAQHDWREPEADGSTRCRICSAHLIPENGGTENGGTEDGGTEDGGPEPARRVTVRLPHRRRAHYARNEAGEMIPLQDHDFYGAMPLRITQAGELRPFRQPLRRDLRTKPQPQPVG